MGEVVQFPQPFRPFYANYIGKPCDVIILPVVRVENHPHRVPRRSTLRQRANALRSRFNPKPIVIEFKDER